MESGEKIEMAENPNVVDDEFSASSDSEGSQCEEENEETDLIHIVDVEKFVSKRLSKANQADFEVSPSMNKFLGKFYQGNINQEEKEKLEAANKINLFSNAVEENKLMVLKEKKNSKKLSSSKEAIKEKNQKMERRNSVALIFMLYFHTIILRKKILQKN